MNAPGGVAATFRTLYSRYDWCVCRLVVGLGWLAGLGLLTMMSVTTLDVILRQFNRPVKGAYDIVKVAGALTIACALPYTTAVKGHVAIEFFIHKLRRRGRIVVDTIARLVVIALFGFLAVRNVQYGVDLKQAGQGTATLKIPEFWIPWVIAVSCLVTALVVLHNLLHPGREMIKP